VLHKLLLESVRASTVCRRLLSVPGVGPVVALTYVTGIDDPHGSPTPETSARISV
jgi:transposase